MRDGSSIPTRTRDPERTEADILKAAVTEFAQHGYHGARIVRIAKAAACNTRMIYHYFGGKEPLYVAALDSAYASLRSQETALKLTEGEPLEAMRRLVAFTFDYFQENQEFLNITRNENILRGEFIRRSQTIRSVSQPLTDAIGRLLDRGVAAGVFQYRPDPLQLYLSVVALSAHHLNNVHTLSATFGEDFSDPEWLARRREHAITMILRDLGAADA